MEQGMMAHLGLLYSVARKLTEDASTAQQLTEHTLHKALRSPEKAEVGQAIKPYLLTTLRQTYIQHYQNAEKKAAIVA
jgi:DNA-directed RNA polymerase specialized sigma24 family protein